VTGAAPASAKDRILVALDVDSLDKAMPLVEKLAPYVGSFKVGLELLTSAGAPQVVRRIHDAGGSVFFDGKFDDIPATIAGASRAVSALGVKMFNVHASCGLESMRAAASAKGKSILLAVTVLTSIDDAASKHSFGAPALEKVLAFAEDASVAGCDGIVCSPRELEALAQNPRTARLLKVTPGIRPAWAAANDQKRALTPAEAVKKGASWLVIGRPILQPPSGTPVDAAKKIIEEIEGALP
jgi:orotidine-5'-phosphate decarboxylase